MKKILTGCSGYYYNHWVGILYPEKLPKKKWLEYYTEHFNTVEINSSFYHLPLDSTLQNWFNITPSHFVFTIKGFRYFTHLKKLTVDKEFIEMLNTFQRKAILLKNKLGCVLWQLPASIILDIDKLEKFCSILDKDLKHVFEFRHPSWFTTEVFNLLKKFNYTQCIISAPDNLPEILATTSEIVYIRFHGKNGWYDDNYSEEQLDLWAANIKKMNPGVLYCYFNNDFHGFALQNGLYLQNMLQKIM